MWRKLQYNASCDKKTARNPARKLFPKQCCIKSWPKEIAAGTSNDINHNRLYSVIQGASSGRSPVLHFKTTPGTDETATAQVSKLWKKMSDILAWPKRWCLVLTGTQVDCHCWQQDCHRENTSILHILENQWGLAFSFQFAYCTKITLSYSMTLYMFLCLPKQILISYPTFKTLITLLLTNKIVKTSLYIPTT